MPVPFRTFFLFSQTYPQNKNYVDTTFAALTLNPYSAGIYFSRQNLTSVDVRFWRLKYSKNISNSRIIGIQINRKELTKTIMMISN